MDRKLEARLIILGVVGLVSCTIVEIDAARAEEPANLSRYKAANAAQLASSRTTVVFLGDSITEGWAANDPALFPATIIDRGVGGQTTSQILLRFYQDVVELHPKVVHIMAGTNDIAENQGPVSDTDILNNFRAMLDIAQAHRIQVVLGSMPPMAKVPWRSDITDAAARIVRLNRQLRALATRTGALYVDYHAVLKNAGGGLRGDLSSDGVHPNAAGYTLMHPLAEQALRQANHHPR